MRHDRPKPSTRTMLPTTWTTERLVCRDATAQDLPLLMDALAESQDIAALDPTFGATTEADLQTHLDRHLRAPDQVRMQVLHRRTVGSFAQEAADFIGFWRLVRVPSRPQAIGVEILLMRPAHRRLGLAQELVAATLEQLRGVGGEGGGELWARVYLANARAMAFWMKAGLRRVVEHQGALIHGMQGDGPPNLILSREILPRATASAAGAAALEGRCHCGALGWRLQGVPESATACNCTVCRRYGVLWAYGHEGEDITVDGPSVAYRRGQAIEFHFCPSCGSVSHWRAQSAQDDGRRRIAVNLRLSDPGPIAALPIDHFDGLHTFDDLPRDGKCVGDLWA